MTRLTALFVTALVVVGTLTAPAAALAQPASGASGDSPSATGAQSETNASDVAPGELLTGVLGVTEAEIDGDIDNRTFGVKVARAATAEAKADVVAEQLGDIEKRLAELRDRKERLNDARENGSIGEGEYKAKMARLAAEVETAERLANASNRTAASLPADVLSEKGIDVAAIRTLKNSADQLTGPEVAEIARSIAGPSVGTSIANGAAPGNVSLPEEAGPPEDAGPGGEENESESRDQRDGQDHREDQGDTDESEDTTTTTEAEAKGGDDTTTTTTGSADGDEQGGNGDSSASDGQGQSGNGGR